MNTGALLARFPTITTANEDRYRNSGSGPYCFRHAARPLLPLRRLRASRSRSSISWALIGPISQSL
jgi:hypothetical protein